MSNQVVFALTSESEAEEEEKEHLSEIFNNFSSTRSGKPMSSTLSFSQLEMSPLEALVRILNNDVRPSSRIHRNFSLEGEGGDSGAGCVSGDVSEGGGDFGEGPTSELDRDSRRNSVYSSREKTNSGNSGSCGGTCSNRHLCAGCGSGGISSCGDISSCESLSGEHGGVRPSMTLPQLGGSENVKDDCACHGLGIRECRSVSDLHVHNWSSLKRTPFCEDLMENFCPIRHSPLTAERREFDVIDSCEVSKLKNTPKPSADNVTGSTGTVTDEFEFVDCDFKLQISLEDKRTPPAVPTDLDCHSCGESMIFCHPRFCHLDGFNYCKSCHLDDRAIIPAKAFGKYHDFRKYGVCRRCSQLIDINWSLPLIDVRGRKNSGGSKGAKGKTTTEKGYTGSGRKGCVGESHKCGGKSLMHHTSKTAAAATAAAALPIDKSATAREVDIPIRNAWSQTSAIMERRLAIAKYGHKHNCSSQNTNDDSSAPSSPSSTSPPPSPPLSFAVLDEKVHRCIWPREYVLTTASKFSYADLDDMSKGVYLDWLDKVLRTCKRRANKL